MKRILFLFDSNGNLLETIEDAESVGRHDKIILVYGYDGTKIKTLKSDEISDYKFITLQDGEKIDYSEINTVYDIEHFKFLQWKKAQKAKKTEKARQATEDLDFLNSRHDKLLELIAYTEKQLETIPYFSKQWEKTQRKLISLENQLRTVDKKREKAFELVNG